MPTIRLKSGREKSLLRRHPWVFSGAVADVEGNPGLGDTVDVLDSHGGFLARGAYSPESQIRVRAWTWDPEVVIGPEFLRQRLQSAITTRKCSVFSIQSLNTENWSLNTEYWTLNTEYWTLNTARLVHAESDRLPGLIVDRYAGTLVMQVLSAGAERWRDVIADLLLELTGAARIYERSDVKVRKLEGLPQRTGPLRGDEPPGRIQICENGLNFWVDVYRGHKTGFYLDQRANRARVRDLARGRDVLDCFAYTGGFTVNALAGGAASVTTVDSSADALSLARENASLNDLTAGDVEWLEADVFQQLRKFRDQGRQFDLIVLDPPKFAPTAAQAQKAARGYKDINLLAFKLLRPGGLLVTFSCSGGISAELFQKIVAGAALDAGVQAQIVEYLHQGADHPVALNFPEGAYLKGLVVRVGG